MNWKSTLQETYYQKGTFKHTSPKRISLFPYTTSPVPEKTLDEMKSFFMVSGEVLRDLAMKDSGIECTPASIFANIKNNIETTYFQDLQHIIKTTLFDENEQIYCFHPTIFYHLTAKHKDKNISSLAHFTRDILFGDNIDLGPSPFIEDNSINVFHSLILKNLPPLSPRKPTARNVYYKAENSLNDAFVQDCTFLKQDPKLFATQLPELLKLYFFIYQLRLIEDLNFFFKDSPKEPFFFSVAWESLSKGRQAYQAGWKRIDKKLLSMFSHAHCLEMVNHIPFPGLEAPFIYSDIKRWIEQASYEQKQNTIEHTNDLIDFYKDGIAQLGFDWEKYDDFGLVNNDDKTLEGKIKYFFKLVQCQFTHSSRKAASKRYSNWLSQFATSNYLKRRGPLGNTLCFSRDQLLFLTRLCIGGNPDGKIRLTELWIEFSRRGVTFDFETRKQVINLFNKLNLIEKKSDSGDAQYVRAIF